MEVASVPLFPPWCVASLFGKKCTALGVTMPCMAPPATSEIFGQNIAIGHWITTILLIVIGVLNLSYATYPWQRADTMTIITGFYAILTSTFAFIRLYFGIGNLILMSATVHNLGEWAILMMIADFNVNEYQIEKSIMNFTFYTLVMIGFVAMMPITIVAAVVEQLAGITADFTLTFVFVYMWCIKRSDNAEVNSFYKYPTLAYIAHLFGTILPLVFANFHHGYTSWYSSFFLEMLIYISAPITHILLMAWSIDFDRKRAIGDTEKDKKGQIPPAYRVKHIKRFIAAGFFCGLIAIVGVPLALGRCHTPENCTPSGEIVGTSVAVVQPGFEIAFEDYVDSQHLIEKAHAFKGNKGYTLVKEVQSQHPSYRFIEHWESEQHLREWIAQVGSKVFSQPAMVNLLVGGKLQQLTGYTNILPSSCRDERNGGVTVDVKSSCDKVWSVVSNWSDCSWELGCSYSVVDPKTSISTLHMSDGSTWKFALRKLDDIDRVLIYEVVTQNNPMTGFTGIINIGDTGSAPNCIILLQFSFRKSSSLVLDDKYQEFLVHRVPYLQKLFSK